MTDLENNLRKRGDELSRKAANELVRLRLLLEQTQEHVYNLDAVISDWRSSQG